MCVCICISATRKAHFSLSFLLKPRSCHKKSLKEFISGYITTKKKKRGIIIKRVMPSEDEKGRE